MLNELLWLLYWHYWLNDNNSKHNQSLQLFLASRAATAWWEVLQTVRLDEERHVRNTHNASDVHIPRERMSHKNNGNLLKLTAAVLSFQFSLGYICWKHTGCLISWKNYEYIYIYILFCHHNFYIKFIFLLYLLPIYIWRDIVTIDYYYLCSAFLWRVTMLDANIFLHTEINGDNFYHICWYFVSYHCFLQDLLDSSFFYFIRDGR